MNRWLFLASLVPLSCAARDPGQTPAAARARIAATDGLRPAWEDLCKHGGCLCGSQDWRPAGLGEGTVLREARWHAFLHRPAEEAVPHLLSRIGSREGTSVHVCPFVRASEGELAVYALQHLLESNWVDYQGDNRVILSGAGVHRRGWGQKALRQVLDDATARTELVRHFADIAVSTAGGGE